MMTTVCTALLLCAVALVIIGLIFPIVIIARLHAIEENLEKTAILLTVLANLQGATDADVARAAGLEEEAPPQPPKFSENKKKGK
ncbi:MAG: hypothetical protein ACI38Q_02075 [Candidatus Bruticola sp.]